MQLSAPPAEHPADFFQVYRQVRVFFGIKRARFPSELEQKFQEIYSTDASIKQNELFYARTVTREETELNRIQEYIVYL